MKVALVHDYLTQRGGAERAFLSMCRAFPDAPVYTSLYEPDLTFPDFAGFDVHPTALNRVRFFRSHHRLALPCLASAFSRLEIDADVMVCSSSGWAHGARTRGAKIVYCHNPARWLYQTNQYNGSGSSFPSVATWVAGSSLRRWDRRAAQSADMYLANSYVVRGRVLAAYGISAEVVEPPLTIDPTGSQSPVRGLEGGYFLCVSRLLRYKNVDAIVEAFAQLPHERLVIVGCGPMETQLRSRLPANVQLVGGVAEPALRWLYAHCDALIAASYEDFGLTPVEAMAFGKPSLVLRWGGFLETMIEGETGVIFDQPTGSAIADAVRRYRAMAFEADLLVKRAEQYSESRFKERLHAVTTSVLAGGALNSISGGL